MARSIKRVAVIGTGVIGASWSALFLANGLEVVAMDVVPTAETQLKRFVESAWPALARLGLRPGASQSNLQFTTDMPAGVKTADFVQENGPERIDLKKKLFAQLDSLLEPDVIIASSSSGLTMSDIQSECQSHPDRCVIAHPFNPPHLIPLVEIAGGAKTSEVTMQAAAKFYTALGKRTIRLNKEVVGHVANRLQAALWREALSLIASGVVSVADADAAVAWGPGLRWGIMGPTQLFHLAGGQGGIEHFLQQFAGPMTAWWNDLGSPELNRELQQKIVDGLHAEVGTRSIDELAARRDEILLGLLALLARPANG
jgi:3-hydroxyacyl-CoA dehydrogenase